MQIRTFALCTQMSLNWKKSWTVKHYFPFSDTPAWRTVSWVKQPRWRSPSTVMGTPGLSGRMTDWSRWEKLFVYLLLLVSLKHPLWWIGSEKTVSINCELGMWQCFWGRKVAFGHVCCPRDPTCISSVGTWVSFTVWPLYPEKDTSRKQVVQTFSCLGVCARGLLECWVQDIWSQVRNTGRRM